MLYNCLKFHIFADSCAIFAGLTERTVNENMQLFITK